MVTSVIVVEGFILMFILLSYMDYTNQTNFEFRDKLFISLVWPVAIVLMVLIMVTNTKMERL